MHSDFQFHISLSRIALVTYSTSVWDEPRTKSKLRTHFLLSRKEEEWYDLINQIIINEVKEKAIPPTIAHEIQLSVRDIGRKLYNWILYVTKFLNLDIEYAMKIYWTNCGTIDVAKIIQLHWSKLKLELSILYEASRCGMLELFLYDTDLDLQKVLDTQGVRCAKKLAMRNKLLLYARNSMIDVYRIKCKVPKDVSSLFEGKTSKNAYVLVFKEAVENGSHVAAKAYFDKMTPAEQQKNVTAAAYVCIREFFSPCANQECKKHIKEGYVDILAFLMRRMPPDDLKIVLQEENLKILLMFLYIWPWQELFYHAWQKELFLKGYHYISLLDFISENVDISFFSRLFQRIWLDLPEKVKQSFLPDSFASHSIFNVVYNLFKAFDFDNLKLIISSYKGDKKESFKKISYGVFNNLVKENKYELFVKLRDELFLTDHERKFFICDSEFLRSYVVNEDYHLIEKILRWQSDSPRERQTIKKRFEMDKLCRECFVSFNYHQSHQMMGSRFRAVDERFHLMDCVLDEFKIIMKNRAVKIEKYTKEEHRSNTMKMIANQDFFKVGSLDAPCLSQFVSRIAQNLKDSPSYRQCRTSVDNFLRYMKLENENINKMKKNILSDMEQYIRDHCLFLNSLAVLEIVIDLLWIPALEQNCLRPVNKRIKNFWIPRRIYFRKCFDLKKLAAICVQEYYFYSQGYFALDDLTHTYSYWVGYLQTKDKMEIIENIKMMSDYDSKLTLKGRMDLIYLITPESSNVDAKEKVEIMFSTKAKEWKSF